MSHRLVYLIAAVFIMMVAAACGSSSESEGDLPTFAVLPSFTPAEETAPTQDAQPTETETTEPTLEPTATTETAEVTPNAEAETPALPFALPQGGTPGSTGNTGSLPPFASGGSTGSSPFAQTRWQVVAEEAITVYSCPETTCEAVGELEPDEEVSVVEPGVEWHTILFEEQTAYVDSTDVQPTGQTAGVMPGGNSGLPPGVNPSDLTSNAPIAVMPGGSGQMQPPSGVGLPPGIAPANVTATPFFPPAQTQAAQQQNGG